MNPSDKTHYVCIFAGMNTGIQDAHNLAWKLASVSQGIAPMSFISTYETERKQVIVFFTMHG